MSTNDDVDAAMKALTDLVAWVNQVLPEDKRAAFHAGCGTMKSALHEVGLCLPPRENDRGKAWAGAVSSLIPDDARLVSGALVRLSGELRAAHDSARKEPDSERVVIGLRNAIGYLYVDLMRPLWNVHPTLKPPEME